MPGNAEAYEVFARCSDQWLLNSMDVPIGMINQSIIGAMDLLMVDDRLECFDRVKAMAGHVRQIKAADAKKAMDNNKATRRGV